jgi:hypothetical protein
MNKIVSFILLLIISLFVSCQRANLFSLMQEVQLEDISEIPEMPEAPESFMVSTLTSNTVDLSWYDNSDSEESFIIERSTDNAVFSIVAELPANTTSYCDSGLEESVIYYYRIKASNVTGNSPYSSTIPVQTFCKLLAHWKLDNDFTDETGNYDAAVTGSFSYSAGRDGYCPVFDWSNAGVVSITEDSVFNKDTYTVTAWVKRYSHNTAPYIRLSDVAHIITNDSGQWQIIGEGEINNYTSGYTLPLFEWHHLTVVFEKTAGEISCYLDGEKIESKNVTSWIKDPTEIRIGEYGGSNRWNGCIDDVRIYDGKLTDSQIMKLYSSYSEDFSEPVPAAPTELCVSAVSCSSIRLSWSDNTNDEFGYSVEQSEDCGKTYITVGTTVPNIESFTVTGLETDSEYFFRVKAFNTSDSDYSSEESVSTAKEGVLPELIAHWKMENNFNDETKHNNAEEIIYDDAEDISCFADIDGKDGVYASLSGSSYGIVENPYGMDRDIYTVMAWARRTSHNTAPYIRLTGIGHFITYSDGQWMFSGENAATGKISSGYALETGQWHHLTTVINRSEQTVKFYLDGELHYTSTISPWMSDGTEILIGRYGASFMWNGDIDDLRIYGGELSMDEISEIFDSY